MLGRETVRVAIAVAIAVTPLTVRAEGWHAGLDLRADPGTHPIRAGGGIDLGKVDTMLVLDPMFWTDGQHDIDLLAYPCMSRRGFGLFGGWRTTAIALAGGHQLQQKLVVGVGAPLPIFRDGPIRARWDFELATVIVKHGADLPTAWTSFGSGRDFIDLVNFGMFVTIEYARR